MKKNHNHINLQEKFKNRTFKPSGSAWERLSIQLEEHEQKKQKDWLFYTGIAASILILFALGDQFFSSEEQTFIPKHETVFVPIDTVYIDTEFKKVKRQSEPEEAVVNTEKKEGKPRIMQNEISKPSVTETLGKTIITQDLESLTRTFIKGGGIVQSSKIIQQSRDNETAKENSVLILNSMIKVNVDDLLFAVTHSKKEIETYYAKHYLNRNDVLILIEKQVEKSILNIDAHTILAEVEGSIREDTFKNNFLQTIKKKVSDLASAVASRNN
jgi:hypothetical protein